MSFLEVKVSKKFVAVLALGVLGLLSPAGVRAQFIFVTNADNTITITGYSGPGGAVTIPGATNGFPIVAIGDNAFSGLTNFTNVVISTGIATIGTNAFYLCSSLTNLTIANSVRSIGNSAFQGCKSLSGVSVPAGVTSIGNYAFASCISLTNATLPGTLTNLGAAAFYVCLKLTNLVIPDGITQIGDNEFNFCQSLTNVSIPRSVTSIGDHAFFNCTSLSRITIPGGVTTLGGNAFTSCSGLTNFYFMGNAPSGDNTEFTSDTGTVYYLPGMTGWSNTFAGLPTAQWFLPNPLVLNQGVGVRSNAFSFTVSWATNTSLVMEAATNLVTPTWLPVLTNPMVNGTNFFHDAKWTNYPYRFYRVMAQ